MALASEVTYGCLTMTTQLLFYGILGVLSTAAAFYWNRHLFTGHRIGPISVLEGILLLRCGQLTSAWLVLQCPLHTPVRTSGELRQLHKIALHELGGRFRRPGLHDYQPRAHAAVDDNGGPETRAQDRVDFFVMSLFTSLAFAIGDVSRLYGTSVSLRTRREGRIENLVAAVVARDEGHPGTPVATGTAHEEPG